MKTPALHLDATFRAFLEAAPDAIVMVDRDGRIVAVNALTEAMFGYTREELYQERVENLVPQRFRVAHERERDAYVRAPHTRPMGLGRDLWGRRKSGDEFPVQISLSPIETDDGTLITSIIRDVSAQRQTEARFRGLLEAAPDGILVADSRGKIVIVNSQLERLFGYTRDEMLGQSIEMLVPERFRDGHYDDRERYQSDPKTRPMGAGRPLTGRTKDGREIPVEISLSPLKTDAEDLVMSIVRDISERRRAEELIKASLREKEAMLKEIHHRVKNNLQVTSSLLRLQTSAIDDPHVRDMFEETQARIRSMALVHEKLYQSTNLSEIDLGDYIRALGALLLQSSGVNDSITIVVTGEPVLLSIEIAVPCGLVVNELLSNALKHAFPDRRHGLIHVQLHGSDCSRTVRVIDDGVGMPSSVNIDSAETLGLRLVRALALQIDGTIAIEPRSSGSAFVFTFPEERSR